MSATRDAILPWKHVRRSTITGGTARLDLDYKSPRTLIEMLNTCCRQNANYLLNIGPKGDGSNPLMAQTLLGQMGIWTNMAGTNFYDGGLSGIACDRDAPAGAGMAE